MNPYVLERREEKIQKIFVWLKCVHIYIYLEERFRNETLNAQENGLVGSAAGLQQLVSAVLEFKSVKCDVGLFSSAS